MNHHTSPEEKGFERSREEDGQVSILCKFGGLVMEVMKNMLGFGAFLWRVKKRNFIGQGL